MLLFLYGTGAMLGEAIQLERKDVCSPENRPFVRRLKDWSLPTSLDRENDHRDVLKAFQRSQNRHLSQVQADDLLS